jgi:hypothetical protein
MDHQAVARMARGEVTVEDRAIERGRGHRLESTSRRPVPVPGKRLYAEGVRRLSLLAEAVLRRR